MWIPKKLTANVKPVFSLLEKFGFTEENDRYTYTSDIIDGDFCLTIYVYKNGSTALEVTDKETQDEYTLVHNPDSVGSFVGRVRTECNEVLSGIISKCYEPDIFKSSQAKDIVRYIGEKYGASPEFLWDVSPDNGIFREPISKKWYAAILTVNNPVIGLSGEGKTEVIDLKETPETIASLVDGKTYLPGYHMNKKHWYTIRLDGSVSTEELFKRIDRSFNLISQKKSRRV